MPIPPETYLRSRGLRPLEWEEVLRAVEARLAPPNLEVFQHRHRGFTAYPMEHTCRAFYDFCAERGLLDLLACFRFDRLRRIGEHLSSLSPAGQSLMEIGAGGGYLSGYIREELQARISVTDWSTVSCEKLKAAGFPCLSGSEDPALEGKTFDILLCADSLGEVNSDEDDWLGMPESAANPDYGQELEQRYGFGSKLEAWKHLLGPNGKILLFEPIGLPAFWEGAAAALQPFGWQAEVLGPEPVWGLSLSARP